MADEWFEWNEGGKGQDRDASGLTPDRFLAPYPRQIREVANELRRLVVETIPNTQVCARAQFAGPVR
jgi:hypothetical protein